MIRGNFGLLHGNQFKKTLWITNAGIGLGYTKISSTYDNIEAGVLYFVPLGENLEIWQLTVKNASDQSKDLSIFSLIEFCLWNAQDDATNFQQNLNIGEVEVEDNVIYHKTEYRERRDHFAFFACSENIEGYDTQREAFLRPYRGWPESSCRRTGQFLEFDGIRMVPNWVPSRESDARTWASSGNHIPVGVLRK